MAAPHREIVYDYSGVPTIRDFSRSDKFMRGLMGPFGSGKSSGCIAEIIRRAHAQPPGPDGIRRSRWAVIRNTYNQLRDTTIKTVHDWIPPGEFGIWFKSDHLYQVTKFPGVYIEILFRALDRPDQVANLLSLELTGAWVNEAREVAWPIIEALQGRVGRYPAIRDGGCSWFGVIMDTNPPDTDSEWYAHFEEAKPDNAEIFCQPSGLSKQAENVHNLPPLYYQNLMKGKDEDFIKVYIKGEYGYVRDGRPVFGEYHDATHCKECEPIHGRPIRRGWDFGLTPACSFSQLLPSGQWIVFDEMSAKELGIDRFSDAVLFYCRQTYPGFKYVDFGDPAGNQRSQTDEKTCFQIMKAKGIEVSPGEVSDAIRIEAVKKPMNTMISGRPGFLLHPRCKILRKGFLGKYRYRRLKTSDERYTDKPEKNEFSHLQDALQYDASMLFSAELRGQTQGWRPLKQPKVSLV